MTNQNFPFAAIVGLERPRRALMLLAVDPGLKGLLIASPPGTGKTLLIRSFESILPETRLDSSHSANNEAGVRARLNREPALSSTSATTRVVELPIGVTEDRLVGCIDFAATLAEGSKRVSTGLLARANGGFICVDHIHLMDSVNLRHLLTALDSGYVAIERDGISSRHEARFALIGTLGAGDTGAAPGLKDRVGLIVDQYEPPSEGDRGEIIYRAERLVRDPRRFSKDFAIQTTKICREVLIARSRLSSIGIERANISRLSSAALDLGIQSSRADLFAVRAARASAALRGGSHVEESDLITAVEYVLLPRAGNRVQQPAVTCQPWTGADAQPVNRRESKDRHPGEAAGQKDKIEEVILQSRDCPLPDGLADSGRALRGSRIDAKAKSGKRVEQTGATHGRYVGALPLAGGYKPGKRIAIDATLRAAAPYQRIRRAAAVSRVCDTGQSLRLVRVGASQSAKDDAHKGRVIIKPGDLRLKKLKHRSGVLFIFLVDTSGSMAVGRIGHAKGVMIRMLRQAYLHRDSVALIAFRGASVEVVLEPTASVELARRAIDSMPAGGATPLAAGLVAAMGLAGKTRKKTTGEIMLLVFTDGRVNVALNSAASLGRAEREAVIRRELEVIGQRLRDHGVRPVVVDTSSWDANGGRCASIAHAIGAKYCRLPGSGPNGLYEQIREFTAEN